MDSGQFEGADFMSDVRQLVSVEHFFLWHEIQDGRQKYDFSSIASKLLHLDPMYVWKMNINLGIATILMSIPSLYLV